MRPPLPLRPLRPSSQSRRPPKGGEPRSAFCFTQVGHGRGSISRLPPPPVRRLPTTLRKEGGREGGRDGGRRRDADNRSSRMRKHVPSCVRRRRQACRICCLAANCKKYIRKKHKLYYCAWKAPGKRDHSQKKKTPVISRLGRFFRGERKGAEG